MLSACKVDGTVSVDVSPDGSGIVTVEVQVDSDAAKQIGDPAKAIRSADLSKAGWRVGKPVVDSKSGAFTIGASRTFDSGDELGEILADIGRGSDGPLVSGVSLEVEDGFARTDYRFAARMKSTSGLADLSDPALTEALGGLPLGRTPEELTAAGVTSKGIGTLRLRVRLPGGLKHHTGQKVGDSVEWSAPIGADSAIDERMVVTSTSRQAQILAMRYVGLAAVVVAIALAAVGTVRRRAH